MPISVQEIVNRCNHLLDAEGSDRYTFDEDYRYAINAATEYVVSLFNSAFDQNKLSPESLKELVYTKIFQASLYSRIAFDSTDMGMSVWTILAVYPKCVTVPISPTQAAAADESVYLDTVSFRDSNYSAHRLNTENWAMRNRNPFVAGSPLITCEDIIEYGYIDYCDYTGGYSLTNSPSEIEISPSIAGETVAVRFIKLPDTTTVIGDTIEFPTTLTNLIVDKTLYYISVKQGEAPLYTVTERELSNLISLMT